MFFAWILPSSATSVSTSSTGLPTCVCPGLPIARCALEYHKYPPAPARTSKLAPPARSHLRRINHYDISRKLGLLACLHVSASRLKPNRFRSVHLSILQAPGGIQSSVAYFWVRTETRGRLGAARGCFPRPHLLKCMNSLSHTGISPMLGVKGIR